MIDGRRIILCAALCLLWVQGTAWAGPADDDPTRPPLERFNKQMVNLRNNIKNAQMKYRNGVVESGMDPEEDRPDSPMRACCRSNHKKLKQRSADLRRALVDLRTCYERSDDAQAIFDLDFFLSDFVQFERGVEMWFEAKTAADVFGVQEGLTRAYLLMSESGDKLAACVLGESKVPADEPGSSESR